MALIDRNRRGAQRSKQQQGLLSSTVLHPNFMYVAVILVWLLVNNMVMHSYTSKMDHHHIDHGKKSMLGLGEENSATDGHVRTSTRKQLDGAEGEGEHQGDDDDDEKDNEDGVISRTNMNILRLAPLVTVAKDKSKEPPDYNEHHPHMGAVDEHGKRGYVHDAAALYQPNSFEYFQPKDAEEKKRFCMPFGPDYHMLTERIKVAPPSQEKKRKAKVFCIVCSAEQYHKTLVKGIRESWGPKCDGFMVASNATDPSLGTVNILHDGPEEYGNLWQKTRSIWSYVYDNYYDDYDFFQIGGDDLFVIPENLRHFVESEEIQRAQHPDFEYTSEDSEKMRPLYLGRRFAYEGDRESMFNSGGSGYTLNKAALKLLVTDALPAYLTDIRMSEEDVLIAAIFNEFQIYPYDTKDKEGGERYMPFEPDMFYKMKKGDPDTEWYDRFSVDIKYGPEGCAEYSVTFHYVKPASKMKRMHAFLYGHCN